MNEVIENILTRRSIRKYKSELIPTEDLKTILNAGRFAPNGMGLQSFQFTAIQDTKVYERVNNAIRETLVSIPIVPETHPYVKYLIEKAKDASSNFFYNAPSIIIVSNIKGNGNAMADSALALGNMMLCAHSLGIGSCWVNQLSGLCNLPKVREVLTELGIPESHNVYATAVFGYADEKPEPDERKSVINIF